MERREQLIMILYIIVNILNMLTALCTTTRKRYQRQTLMERPANREFLRVENLNRLIYGSDIACMEQLRMDRHTFTMLCSMLRTIGKLKDSKYVDVEEMVALFLHILAHHVKNRVIKFRFLRSEETISRHFNAVLNAVIRLQGVLLKKPEPVSENSTDERWKWFKVYKL